MLRGSARRGPAPSVSAGSVGAETRAVIGSGGSIASWMSSCLLGGWIENRGDKRNLEYVLYKQYNQSCPSYASLGIQSYIKGLRTEGYYRLATVRIKRSCSPAAPNSSVSHHQGRPRSSGRQRQAPQPTVSACSCPIRTNGSSYSSKPHC